MGLIFDGVDLELTYGVVVSGAGSWAKPERDRELVHVPGRNGDLIYDNGCWLNVEIPYSLYFRDGWLYKYEEFCEWLCSHVGYFRLEDPDRHPGVYRMAEFAGPLDPKKWLLSDDGIVTITFNCKPQQWLLDGEQPVKIQFTPVVLGYFNADNQWVSGTDGKGYSTVLMYLKQGLSAEVSITIPPSGESRTIVFGDGLYIGSGEGSSLQSSNVREFEISAAETRRFSVTWEEGAYHRFSFYSDAGLDDVWVDISYNGAFDPEISQTIKEYHLRFSDNEIEKEVNNPTNYASAPLLTVKNLFGEALNINDYTIRTYYTSAPETIIDCELETCYYISGDQTVSANYLINIYNSDPKELRDFPYLSPGKNVVSMICSEGETADPLDGNPEATIIPRWFKI